VTKNLKVLVVWLVGNLLDVSMTQWALGYQGMEEVSPWGKLLLSWWGFPALWANKLVVGLGVGLLLYALGKNHPMPARVLEYLSWLMVFVCVWNAYQIVLMLCG
jgi:hypothetical protein